MTLDTNSVLAFTVSTQDMIDLWIETLHPTEHVVAVWDARSHFDLLKKELGVNVDECKLYNNRILTLIIPKVLEAFKVMDYLTDKSINNEKRPFIQVYSNGKLLTDNIDEIN